MFGQLEANELVTMLSAPLSPGPLGTETSLRGPLWTRLRICEGGRHINPELLKSNT